MRVFVTGATGFVGSAVVPELLANGHTVLGMSRSEEGDAKLRAAGAEVHRGDIKDLASLKAGVAAADAVIHLAFNHDFSTFAQNSADDYAAISAMGEVLGSKPMLVTSGVGGLVVAAGKRADENDRMPSSQQMPRAASEEGVDALVAKGLNVGAVRLSQIHDTTKAGLFTYYKAMAQGAGFFGYAGEGQQMWAAAHVSDIARLYRLAIETLKPGERFHGVAEEAIALRDVAETLGKALGLPVRSLKEDEVAGYFASLPLMAHVGFAASSEMTKERLGWTPSGVGLLEDLAQWK